jgi:hypothetical protein
MQEPFVVFRPGQAVNFGKDPGAVATAIKKGRDNKPEVWVWKPEVFNQHIYEHEKYHIAKEKGYNKRVKTINDMLAEEIRAERHANKKIYGKDDLTASQSSNFITRLYTMYGEANPELSKTHPFNKYLKHGVSGGIFEDTLGMRPSEIKKGANVLGTGWDMTYDYGVKVKNYQTGEERDLVIASRSKNIDDAKANIRDSVEEGRGINGEKDWYVQKIDRLAKVAPNPSWGIGSKRTNGKWAKAKNGKINQRASRIW